MDFIEDLEDLRANIHLILMILNLELHVLSPSQSSFHGVSWAEMHIKVYYISLFILFQI